MELLKRTWAEISLDELKHNYHTLLSHLPQGTEFLGVVKADAYGHGAVPISSMLEQLGCRYLAVSNLEEAVQIRRGGVHAPILILGFTPPEFADTLVSMSLTQEVHSAEYALALEERLKGTNYVLRVHLKFDTGMGRIGFLAYEPQAVQSAITAARLPHLYTEGAFTHFCVSDSKAPEDAAFTALQYERFTQALAQLAACGIKPCLRHCANSGAVLLHPEYAMDMVRPGIALYGANASADTAGILDLHPVMTLHTTVSQIRTLQAGVPVSYGRTHLTGRETKVAVLPIGYADGLPRKLSGRVCFRLHGKEAPVLGRICMDMCMVDITDIPEAAAGDTVTVFGRDESGFVRSVDELAALADTIGYELLCSVSKRVTRLCYADGKECSTLQYIV